MTKFIVGEIFCDFSKAIDCFIHDILLSKLNFMQFTIKTGPQIGLDFSYANKLISKFYDTTFLGMYVDSTLSWKNHVEQITHKLSAACYAMRSVKSFMSQETLTMVYYAYFQSIMNCGLIFGGKSSHSALIFKIQKRMIRIITGCDIETQVEIYLRI